MKKLNFLLLAAALLMTFGEAQAWGRRVHATIAYIAEQHLTPEAKAKVNEILGGKSMVYYGSWLDDNKPEMLIPVSRPYKGKMERTIPHTFKANEKCKVKHEPQHECIDIIDKSIAQLKHYRDLDDSTRMVAMQCLIHLVGDMHCPAHVLFDDGRDRRIGGFNVVYNGKETKYHKMWDSQIVDVAFAGGVADLAYIADRSDEAQIAKIQKGSATDWGNDIIDRTKDAVWSVQAGDELDRKFTNAQRELAVDQIQRAGYRLAKVMNDLFGSK